MNWFLIYEILGCVYAQLVLEVGMLDLDNSSILLYKKFLVETVK